MIPHFAAALTPIPAVKDTIHCNLALTDKDCTDVSLLLANIANWMIAIAATLFFLMLLVGGIQYLTSAGNEEQAGKAKNTLLWAIVGLVVILASWAVLKFFIERLS